MASTQIEAITERATGPSLEPPTHDSRRRRAAGALAALLGLGVAFAAGDTSPMVGGTRAVVDLAAGDATSVHAWKTEGSWSLRVTNSSGDEVVSITWRAPPATSLTWVADRDDTYTIACQPQGASPAICEVDLPPEGTAISDPRQRMQAATAIRKGHELLGDWSTDAYRRAAGEFADAYDRGQALGSVPLQVDALLGLARKHRLAGEVDAPGPLLREALARAVASNDPRRVVLAAVGLASSLEAHGDTDEAERHLREALETAREIGFRLGTAAAHLGRGDVHYAKAEFADAEREQRSALEIYQDIGNTAGTIEAHISLGYTLADLSEDAPAKNHFQEALQLARASGDRRHEAIALRVLGNVSSKMSEGHEAIRFFEAAQRLFEDAGERAALVALYNGLGEVHARLNDLTVAIQYHQKAETLARETGFLTGQGSALIEIASCRQRLGQTAAATEGYEKARELSESIGDTALLGSALEGLGGLHAAEGRFQRAVQYLEEALALLRSVGEARQSSRILSDLAETYLSMGHTARSREAAREAVVLARDAADLTKEARALFILARVAREDAALDEAKTYAERALAVDESIRARAPSRDLRAMFFAGVELRYGFYIDLLMRMKQARPAGLYDRLALEASERARARVLLDRLHASPSASERTDAELVRRERMLREQIRRHALLTDLAVQDDGLESAEQFREMLAELRRLQGLAGAGPTEAGARGHSSTLSFNEIQTGILGEKTLVVEYLLGPDRSYLWTVSRNHYAVHVLPPRETIEAAAREAYASVTARQRPSGESARERRARTDREDARFYGAGAALAQTLLGPIRGLDEYERLVIVADGLLHYVPFSALPHPRAAEKGEADYQPLVLSHQVVRAPSLSAAAAMRERSRRTGPAGEPGDQDERSRVAVLADPVFTFDDPRVPAAGRGSATPAGESHTCLDASPQGSGQGIHALPRLLASRQEASSIARVGATARVTVATGFQASRAAAEGMLREANLIVHFATHGVLNDEHPGLSGIVTSLMDEQGQLQDGFLRAQDIYGMQIAAELVVLSGCETALGKMLRGEGITGLVRSFMHAGADTVVASKWRVDDLATQELMTEFYRLLLVDGLDPAAALRAAQIKLFRRKASRAPFFWGAFEVHGIS